MSIRKPAAKSRAVVTRAEAPPPLEASFAEVVGLIEQARQRAYQAVNTELVGLYWRIGEYISGKLAAAEWGEGVVDRLAAHLARVVPGPQVVTDGRNGHGVGLRHFGRDGLGKPLIELLQRVSVGRVFVQFSALVALAQVGDVGHGGSIRRHEGSRTSYKLPVHWIHRHTVVSCRT